MMKMKMVILYGAVVGMVLLTACSGSSGSGRKTEIDLDDYVIVTFEGYDGIGTATAEIDYAALESDYGNKIKVNRSKKDELPGDYAFQYVEEYTDVSVSPDSELSNGDSVKLVWDVNDEFFDEYLNYTFLYSDRTIEVSGLDETSTVDVFDGVDVLFSGVAPVGEASISVDNDYDSGQYTLDRDSDLSNGDVVTVTYDLDIDRFIEEKHAVPESTSKEFTVYGLDSYILDMSQFSEEDINVLKEDAKKIVNECFNSDVYASVVSNSDIGNVFGLEDVDRGDDYLLENIYFLNPKEPGPSQLIFIYSVSLTATYQGITRTPPASGRIYYAVAYTDLLQEDTGKIVGTSEYNVESYNGTNSTYQKYVTENKDKYIATIYDADLNVVD